MKLLDIVDGISEILLTYYLYHRTIDNTAFKRADVICYLSNRILQYFGSHEDPDSDIHSIYVLFGIDEREYVFSDDCDDHEQSESNNPSLFQHTKCEAIINHIMFCVTNGLYIRNRDNIISVNVVPFDGLSISKGFVLRTLDEYFYK